MCYRGSHLFQLHMEITQELLWNWHDHPLKPPSNTLSYLGSQLFQLHIEITLKLPRNWRDHPHETAP